MVGDWPPPLKCSNTVRRKKENNKMKKNVAYLKESELLRELNEDCDGDQDEVESCMRCIAMKECCSCDIYLQGGCYKDFIFADDYKVEFDVTGGVDY